MKISTIERGLYFRGLLILIRKDGQVTDEEKVLIRRIGARLGFEKDFYEGAIKEILKNEYITDEPPVFFDKKLAAIFIQDGLIISYSDHEIDKREEDFLLQTTLANGFSEAWFWNKKSVVNTREDCTLKLHIEQWLESDTK